MLLNQIGMTVAAQIANNSEYVVDLRQIQRLGEIEDDSSKSNCGGTVHPGGDCSEDPLQAYGPISLRNHR